MRQKERKDGFGLNFSHKKLVNPILEENIRTCLDAIEF
jgi:hypothetical protein